MRFTDRQEGQLRAIYDLLERIEKELNNISGDEEVRHLPVQIDQYLIAFIHTLDPDWRYHGNSIVAKLGTSSTGQ